MTSEDFISMVRKELKDSGGRLILHRKQTLDENKTVTGVFDPDGNIIECAKYNEKLLWVILHEFGHHCQKSSNSKVWENYLKCPYSLEQILENKKLKNHILPHLKLELDAERRAIHLAQELKLPINIKKYSRWANTVIFKYFFIYLGLYPWMKTTDKQSERLSKDMPDTIVNFKYLKQYARRLYPKWKSLVENF